MSNYNVGIDEEYKADTIELAALLGAGDFSTPIDNFWSVEWITGWGEGNSIPF